MYLRRGVENVVEVSQCVTKLHDQEATTAGATRSNETCEETGQVKDLVRFRGNLESRRSTPFPRTKLNWLRKSPPNTT